MLLTNGTVEVEIAERYGPRITRYAFCGEQSVFGDGGNVAIRTSHGTWRPYGGHRMWLAPEEPDVTYRIDDAPPELHAVGEHEACAVHAGDARGFTTEIAVRLEATGSNVYVTHRATNVSTQSQLVAPWALSIVRPGGRFVLPLPAYRTHAEAPQAAGSLALWAYAALGDARVSFEEDLLALRCDGRHEQPWKAGSSGERGWCAYLLTDVAFVKQFDPVTGASYPDRGSAVQAYTAGGFGELETLGPLVAVAPGERIEHRERWSLQRMSPDGTPAQLREKIET